MRSPLVPRIKPWLKPGLILGLPLALILAWGSGAFHRRVGPGTTPAGPPAAPLAVHVATLGREPVGAGVPGTVVAEARAVIAGKLLSTVRAIAVREGDVVRPGQTLVELDPTELDARAAVARAAAEQADAAIGVAAGALEAARSGEVRARVQRDAAAATYARMRRLADEGAVTAQDLADAEAAMKGAAAGHDQARRQAEGARARLAEARAGAGHGRAAVRQADADRAFARIAAPFAGTVVRRWLDPGAMAAPGQPILELVRGPFRLDVAVEGRLAAALAPGRAVAVTLDAPAIGVAGRVARVVPAIDPASRTAVVQVALPAVAGLLPGAFGRASFPALDAPAVAVPAAAVVRWYNLTSVFAAAPDGRAELRLVRLGERTGDRYEVLDGLAAGERVVLEPPAALRDGMRIEARP